MKKTELSKAPQSAVAARLEVNQIKDSIRVKRIVGEYSLSVSYSFDGVKTKTLTPDGRHREGKVEWSQDQAELAEYTSTTFQKDGKEQMTKTTYSWQLPDTNMLILNIVFEDLGKPGSVVVKAVYDRAL